MRPVENFEKHTLFILWNIWPARVTILAWKAAFLLNVSPLDRMEWMISDDGTDLDGNPASHLQRSKSARLSV